jgi:hypothetical protein
MLAMEAAADDEPDASDTFARIGAAGKLGVSTCMAFLGIGGTGLGTAATVGMSGGVFVVNRHHQNNATAASSAIRAVLHVFMGGEEHYSPTLPACKSHAPTLKKQFPISLIVLDRQPFIC